MHTGPRLEGCERIHSEGRIPDAEWARALESRGSSASRIRNLAGSLPSFHRLSVRGDIHGAELNHSLPRTQGPSSPPRSTSPCYLNSEFPLTGIRSLPLRLATGVGI